MSYNFTYDFAIDTTFGFAEVSADISYEVIDGELFINRNAKFKGKLYTEEGDIICDFVTEKHHELGKQIYDSRDFSIVHACNDDYRKNGG